MLELDSGFVSVICPRELLDMIFDAVVWGMWYYMGNLIKVVAVRSVPTSNKTADNCITCPLFGECLL